ncbi:MAG: rod-binding protein [Proteobacteria bacterium]|nr:rod-binding protein [Pseudomonadota bacterium]
MISTPNINIANDVGAVNGLRQVARKDKETALREVAKQFEAIMMQQMLKSSRETTWDDGFSEDMPGGGSMDSYREWRDDQFAQTLSAKGSLGLADMLVKQLMPKNKATSNQQITETSLPANETKQTPTVSSASNAGWWRVPAAAEVVAPKVTNEEVALPSTEEALLLHNLLQGRIKNRVASTNVS